jgi:hypothetical protein
VTREQLGKLELLDKLVSLETPAVRVPRVELVTRDHQEGQAHRELLDLLDQRECLLSRLLEVPLVPPVLLEQLDLPEQLVLRVNVARKVLQVLQVSLGQLDRRVRLVSRVSRELLEPLVNRALRVHEEKPVVQDHREPLEHRE